jgi:IrrE N-terminal-like domain
VKRGYKSECESQAAAVRAGLGLTTRDALDPRILAADLDIPIHPLSSLTGTQAVVAAVRHVMEVDRSVLSAMTIFPDWPRRRRVIIFNDANLAVRQNSDLVHEIAHGLRLHEPRHAIAHGCRDYSKPEEDEAAWLAGCLLVPRDAAFAIAISGTPLELAASQYGVSTQMMSWRVNATGSKLQAARTAARRRSVRRPIPGPIAPDQQVDHQNRS